MPSSFNNNNKQSFTEKMKDEKTRRSYILTAVALCLALLIIIISAAMANRTEEPDPTPTIKDNENESETESENESQSESESESQSEAPSKKPDNSSNANSGLPSFTLPANGTLTNKHDPELQVFSPTMQDYRVHLGIDIQTEENAPVYAAADGTVSKIWSDTLMGYCVAIKHAGNCVTVYKNLAATLPQGIAEGVSVRAGQLIASVGNSAMVEVADEAHLHFEMTVADLAVDPLEYFSEESLKAITKE